MQMKQWGNNPLAASDFMLSCVVQHVSSPEWSALPSHIISLTLFTSPGLTLVSHIFHHTFPLISTFTLTHTRNSMEPKGGIKPFQITRLAVPLLLVLVRPFPLLPASPSHCRWQSVLGRLVSRALRQELCSVTRGGLQNSGPSLYMEASPAPVSNNDLPAVLYKVSS